jgi:hypothetical protein
MALKRSLEDPVEDTPQREFQEAQLQQRTTQDIYNTVRNLCRPDEDAGMYLERPDVFHHYFRVYTQVIKNPLLPTKLGVNQPEDEWQPEPNMVEVHLMIRKCNRMQDETLYTLYKGYNLKYPLLLKEKTASRVDESGIFGSRKMEKSKEAWPQDVYMSQTNNWLKQLKEEGWCLDPSVFIEHPTKGTMRAIDCIQLYFTPK